MTGWLARLRPRRPLMLRTRFTLAAAGRGRRGHAGGNRGGLPGAPLRPAGPGAAAAAAAERRGVPGGRALPRAHTGRMGPAALRPVRRIQPVRAGRDLQRCRLGAAGRGRAAGGRHRREAGRGRPARVLLRREQAGRGPCHGVHHAAGARSGRAAGRAARHRGPGGDQRRHHAGPAQRDRGRAGRAGRLGGGARRAGAGRPAGGGRRGRVGDRGSGPPGGGAPGRRIGPAGRVVQHHARRAAAVAVRAATAGQRRQPRAAHPADQPAPQRRDARRRARPARTRAPGGARPGGRPSRRIGPAGRQRHRAGPGRVAARPARRGGAAPGRRGQPWRAPGGTGPRPSSRRSSSRGRLPGEAPTACRSRSGTCWTTRPSSARPASRSRCACGPASSPYAITARASPRPTFPMSSTVSTGRRRPAASPAPASGCPSSARWPSVTAERSGPKPPPEGERSSASGYQARQEAGRIQRRTPRWPVQRPDRRALPAGR